jgi:hypothetical protein
MWTRYNPNPAGRKVGDCAVRAVSAALGTDWEEAFDMLSDAARGKDVTAVMDELMSTLEVIQPRLYDGVMRKIRELA